MPTTTTDAPAITPTGDRLLVRRDEAEAKSRGGILIPDTAKSKPRLGTVLAVGPGRYALPGGDPSYAPADGRRIPVAFRPGQKVLFNVYGQHEVPGFEGLILVREEDVLAVME